MYPLFPLGAQIILDPNKPYKDRSYVLAELQQCKTPIFRLLVINADQLILKPLSPDLEQYSVQLMTAHDKILACLVEAKLLFDTKDSVYG